MDFEIVLSSERYGKPYPCVYLVRVCNSLLCSKVFAFRRYCLAKSSRAHKIDVAMKKVSSLAQGRRFLLAGPYTVPGTHYVVLCCGIP